MYRRMAHSSLPKADWLRTTVLSLAMVLAGLGASALAQDAEGLAVSQEQVSEPGASIPPAPATPVSPAPEQTAISTSSPIVPAPAPADAPAAVVSPETKPTVEEAAETKPPEVPSPVISAPSVTPVAPPVATTAPVEANVPKPVTTPPPPPEWRHESEAGMTIIGGNSSIKTFNAKQETVYERGQDKMKSTGQYLLSTASGLEVARNWSFNLRYERSLADRLSIYFGSGADGNRFAGRQYRINGDVGARYYILPGDKLNEFFAQETGLRYIYEYRTQPNIPPTIESPSLRIYFEGAAPLSDTLSFNMSLEILPNLIDYRRILLNTEASLKLLVTRHLYLKVTFRANYVGLPVQASLSRWDYVYTTSLVIKY